MATQAPPPTHWNDRVIFFEHPRGNYYAMHEVYYTAGAPRAWGRCSQVFWNADEAADTPKVILRRMRRALAKSPLTAADFGLTPEQMIEKENERQEAQV
jgi:hypothetical protein